MSDGTTRELKNMERNTMRLLGTLAKLTGTNGTGDEILTACIKQIAEATRILQSNTDPAACEADKCGCMACTLPELAQGAREEIAELQRKHGLLVAEVKAWRAWYRCEPHHPTKQDQTAVERNRALIATDAGGAIERSGG